MFTDAGAAFLGGNEIGLSERLTLNAAVDPRQGGALWRLRETASEAQRPEGGSIKHDVSVPVARLPQLLAELDRWLAQSRPRKLLTVVTKSNAQRHAMVMWDEIALQIAKEFPDVKWDKELVDAATARMVNRPATLDTIVATNLHADILSDLAAALAGSLGIAPTGNIDPERRYPSMFEPIHGSAFDIMGKGLANPVGTFWSVVMLLEHIGEPAAAQRLMAVIESVTANPALHTGDLGGKALTADVTQAVCKALA